MKPTTLSSRLFEMKKETHMRIEAERKEKPTIDIEIEDTRCRMSVYASAEK